MNGARRDSLEVLVLSSLAILITLSLFLSMVPLGPRLVGFGCVGSHGPLYAEEEDHFPKCEAIERNR